MPLAERQALQEVNTYEGVTCEHMLLRYSCGLEVPFEADAIVRSRKRSVKGKSSKALEYLVKWRGYKESASAA